MHAFLQANSFGNLINQTDVNYWQSTSRYNWTLTMTEELFCINISSKESLQWKSFSKNDQILLVFFGLHFYILTS
ncbi:hypothetical protein [Flavobacterium sp. ACAM 123]|uniref:hypothetical protein n=1 Tax=Flavobacterium sp. ACAM 123 TaxID=1189620 RepID=UPI00397786CE